MYTNNNITLLNFYHQRIAQAAAKKKKKIKRSEQACQSNSDERDLSALREWKRKKNSCNSEQKY